MKTIQDNSGNVERKSDEVAEQKVNTGKWHYVPKSVWKESKK